MSIPRHAMAKCWFECRLDGLPTLPGCLGEIVIMRKRSIVIVVCLLVCALTVCQLLSIESAQTRRIVTHYANILREAEDVKSAFRDAGVKNYSIYSGRQFMHHHIEIAVDRQVQDRRHLERICVDCLKANVEAYQWTTVTVIVDAYKATEQIEWTK